jgi:hypothetical protein
MYQLENKKIIVRKSSIPVMTKIISVMVILLIVITAAIYFPAVYQFYADDKEFCPLAILSGRDSMFRGLAGLVNGLILSFLGIKFIRPETLVLLIRFFLITFILLLSIFYFSMK